MDNFFGMVSQSWTWRYFFSHFGWVDWMLTFFLFIGVLLGLKNGLSRELPRIFEALISLYVTMESYPFFALWLSRETPWPEAHTKVLTFALLWVLSGLSLRILFEIAGRLVHLEVSGPFQWLAGVLVGSLRYYLFFSMISYFLILFPLDWTHRSYKVQSWSGQVLTQTPPKIQEWINSILLRRQVV